MAASAQTNVLQNINLQLTIYQQGVTNSTGTKVFDQVTSYTTKNLIAALEEATGQTFGNSAKLVFSTPYSNIVVPIYSTNFSTNLALGANSYLSVGGINFLFGFFDSNYYNAGIMTISNDTFITGAFPGGIASNVLSVVTGGVTTQSVTIQTNALTTLTPSTDTNGVVTNVAVLTEQLVSETTEPILTNGSSSIDILYNTTNLFSVNNYLNFSQISPAQILVETGDGLNTTNTLTVSNLASQTGFSIENLDINCFTPTSSNILTLILQGFVKQAMKIDVLAPRKGSTAAGVADIFGASSTWNVNGFGYAGGTIATTPTSVQFPPNSSVYLSNAVPVIVEGSVSISFLKNLP
jgi:hypothetical protein